MSAGPCREIAGLLAGVLRTQIDDHQKEHGPRALH